MPRRRRRRGASIASFLVVILAILGIYFVQSGSDATDIVNTAKTALPGFETVIPDIGDTISTVVNPNSATPAAPGSDTQSSSSDWWEVYFTDPLRVNDPTQWQNSIEGRLIDKINAAQSS